jgi:hypothetical protein
MQIDERMPAGAAPIRAAATQWPDRAGTGLLDEVGKVPQLLSMQAARSAQASNRNRSESKDAQLGKLNKVITTFNRLECQAHT